MDKTAIRNFAIEARKILMKSAIAEAGFYGISKDGVKASIQKGKDFEVYETLAGTEKRIFGDDIKRRKNLANAVKELGFDQVIEETAYTWFNRIIAIRFMEVNNYLPTRVRVLSSETGSSTPDIVTQADTVELNMSVAELEKVQQAKQDNKYDEAFRLLFIKQCNELNAILPGLFEKTNDYMELLLKIPYTGDGVIRMLIDTIPEDNFNVDTEGQVEIIGWMYQYYNTELKDDTFAKLKKNVKITKERIPAATQLFTPDWIVRYMVENSLGRVWIEHLRAVDSSVDEKSKAEEFGWKYYLPEAEQEENVAMQLVDIRASYKNLKPQDITCIDPCMGSGHILVYMFDVLMDIYRSEGFSEREAVFDILEKNIRGLDIDRRAYQLSYFALMMKARGYNRIFFRGHENLDGERVQAVPQVYAIEESNSINREHIKYLGTNMEISEKQAAVGELNCLLDGFIDAKIYGSILNVKNYNFALLGKLIDDYSYAGQMSLDMIGIGETIKRLLHLVAQCRVMSDKYYSVVTNPPYMGNNGMSKSLSDFLKREYNHTKTDLFAASFEKLITMIRKDGYCGLVVMQSWMFLSSFEYLRDKVYKEHTLVSLLHMGDNVMGIAFGTAANIISGRNIANYVATFNKVNLEELENGKISEIEKAGYRRCLKVSKLEKISGKPIAYWVSDALLKAFELGESIEKYVDTFQGIITGDNEKFLRFWHEVDFSKIALHKADMNLVDLNKQYWIPYNKGGDFRKWYGIQDYVVYWKNGPDDKTRGKKGFSEYYLRDYVSWSYTVHDSIATRYYPNGFLWDVRGSGLMDKANMNLYLEGLISSKVGVTLFHVNNSTISCQVENILQLPIILDTTKKEEVDSLVRENNEIAKIEWDSYEESWDFVCHPLVKNGGLISDNFASWESERQNAIEKCKNNEERLNQIFIGIYGLENELDWHMDYSEITLRKADREADIKSLISYAIGCLLGRYASDRPGIVYAGGNINDEICEGFIVKDNVLLLTDTEYFKDDAASLICGWIKETYGAEYYEENLQFIGECLGCSENPVKAIREYLLTDFYSDHKKKYRNAPVYWMFSAGQEKSFSCITYLHRYLPELVGVIRSDYLLKTQTAIENALKNAEYIISTSKSSVDKAMATKDRDKFIRQLAEIRLYYQALSHVALEKLPIDLDDGVKKNYGLFQNIEVSFEGEKKQTINLLAKL